MPVDSNPTVPADALEATPATPLVAFMRSRPARVVVWTVSALATGAALTIATRAALAGHAPLAAMFGGLSIPLSAGVLGIGRDNHRSGDLFPNNQFCLKNPATAWGTISLSAAFAALFAVAGHWGLESIKAKQQEQARTAAAPELARDALVPAANLCGSQKTGHVYTMIAGKEHRVSCVAK